MDTIEAALLLIDDEIAAIASREGANWPSITPTLIGLEESHYLSAVDRGVKSLLMRGILGRTDAGEIAAEVMERVRVVLRGGVKFRTFVGTYDFAYDFGYSTTTTYEGGDVWLSEMTTPLGAHYLFRADESGLVRLSALQLDGVYRGSVELEAGPQGSSVGAGPRCLCMLAMLEDGDGRVRAVRAQKGEIAIGHVAVTSGRFEHVGSVGSGSDAIDFVVGRADA